MLRPFRFLLILLFFASCLFANGQASSTQTKKKADTTAKKDSAATGTTARQDSSKTKSAEKTGKSGKSDAAGKDSKDTKNDEDPDKKKAKAAVAEECPKDAAEDAASVVKVTAADVPSECKDFADTKSQCSVLSYAIEVTVRNVCRYLVDHTKTGSDQPKRSDMVLFLDNRPLKEVGTAPVARNQDDGTETFRVQLTPKPADDKQRAEWAHVIMKTYWGSAKGDPLAVSLGLPEVEPIPIQGAQPLLLKIPFWSLPALLIMVGLGVVLILMAWLTPLVRDGKGGPFSLSKCQMAWWFYLVIASWVCTAAVMLSPTTITRSALVLMGISAATGLSAIAIDKKQKADDHAAGAAAPAARASHGIFKDLITDRDGEMTIHRFQMLAWTIVLGIYFLYYVFTTMEMPEFENNLLILMGISSGTYVGVKTQEKKNE